MGCARPNSKSSVTLLPVYAGQHTPWAVPLLYHKPVAVMSDC